MSVTLTALQDKIAALGIAGMRRIYTSADLPRGVYQRGLPILMPDPLRPLESSVSTRLTLGGSGWHRTRVLNYVCIVAELAAGRSIASYGEQLAAQIDAVENAFCDFSMAGLHYVGSVTIGDTGLIQDTGAAAQTTQYVGFTAQLTVVMSY